MSDQDERWQHVGEAITARMSEKALSQAELAEKSGVSVFTIRRLQRGEAGNYRRDRLQKLSVALDWTHDSITLLTEGGEPSEAANTFAAYRDPDKAVRHIEMILDAFPDHVALDILNDLRISIRERPDWERRVVEHDLRRTRDRAAHGPTEDQGEELRNIIYIDGPVKVERSHDGVGSEMAADLEDGGVPEGEPVEAPFRSPSEKE